MFPPRRLASAMLRSVERHAPPGSREWASAMLRELDSIESDWAAFFWALGSSTAIFRHSGRALLNGNFDRNQRNEEDRAMKDLIKEIAQVFIGVAAATLLAAATYGALRLSVHLYPALLEGRVPWIAWLVVIAVPETLFIAGAVKLWRRQKPIAVGILLAAIVLGVHFAIHLASRWNG